MEGIQVLFIFFSLILFPSLFYVGKNLVQQAPCQNHCNAIAKLSKENEQIRKMGQRLKKVYLQAAQTIRDKEVCITYL